MLAACVFKASEAFGRVDCSAGASPNSSPVAVETANVNATMRQSGTVEMG